MAPKKLFLASTVLFILSSLPLISLVGASLEMWSQTYGGSDIDHCEAMVQTGDGGFALAGETQSFGVESIDFWLVKTDEYGIIPEFPSWTILSLFLTVTLVVAIYRKKLSKTSKPSFILGS